MVENELGYKKGSEFEKEEEESERVGGRESNLEQTFIKFKKVRGLREDVPDTLKPLEEDRRTLGIGEVEPVFTVSKSSSKLVSKGDPLLFNEHHEANDGSVIGIHHQFCQRGDLSGPVPAIRAVDKHGHLGFNQMIHSGSSIQDLQVDFRPVELLSCQRVLRALPFCH